MGLTSTEDYWQHFWRLIEDGVTRRKSEFHLAVATNVRRDGYPQSRTVVSRMCDSANQVVGFHTDSRSARVQDLRDNPRGQMLYYGPAENIQVRLTGSFEVHAEDDVAAEAWKLSPGYSRKCYMFPVPSSEPLTFDPEPLLTNPELPETEEFYPNFAVIHLRATEIELLHLAAAGHVRYRWTLTGSNWVCSRLSP